MAWKKASPELGEMMAEALAPFPAQRRVMFGSPCWFVNGNMFAGVHQDRLFMRLPAIEQQELFAETDEAAPFEPLPGRLMKDYVALPETFFENGEELRQWLGRSYRWVNSLPPKEKKAGKKKG